MNAQESLKRLLQGNKRFTAGKSQHPNQDAQRLKELTTGQKPIAIIIGCSDSRVPPEIIFDQGLGDLFVVRLAGNVVDDMAIGSIEYATEHLGTQLVMVLGHTNCGAVTATVNGDNPIGLTASFLEAIKPAIEKARGISGDTVDNAAKENVKMVVEQLKSSTPVLAGLFEAGRVTIIGAYYDLRTGLVDLIQ